MKKFRVYFRGVVVGGDLTFVQTADTLHDLALQFYEGEEIDINDIQMEEMNNGS